MSFRDPFSSLGPVSHLNTMSGLQVHACVQVNLAGKDEVSLQVLANDLDQARTTVYWYTGESM